MNCPAFLLFLMLTICGLGQASADPMGTPTPGDETPGTALQSPSPDLSASPSPTSSPASHDLKLSGRFGMGSGFINARTGSALALSLRYWVSEKACIDLLGSYNEYSNDGYTFSDAPVQEPYYQLGCGVGFKYNLAEVKKNLFLQLMAQGTFYQNHSAFLSTYVQETVDYYTWGLFGGVSLEYFLPFFDSLSVESSIGYMQGFDSNTFNMNYNPVYYTGPLTNVTTGAGTDGRIIVNGGTLGSLYLHLYL